LAIKTGNSVPCLDFRKVAGAQRDQAARMFVAWADLKSKKRVEEPRLAVLLTGLGFTVQKLWELERIAGRELWSMDAMLIEIGDEQISDIDDLEIGQLAHVARICRLSPSIQQKAEKWRKLRNKIAHLEPLSADEALDSDIFRNGQ
jgi:hypothetical protein